LAPPFSRGRRPRTRIGQGSLMYAYPHRRPATRVTRAATPGAGARNRASASPSRSTRPATSYRSTRRLRPPPPGLPPWSLAGAAGRRPQGERRQPDTHGRGGVIDDVIDPRRGGQRGDRREGRVLAVDPRPDAGAGADDWEFLPPDLVGVRPVGVEPGARSVIEPVPQGDTLHAAGQHSRLQLGVGLRVGCHLRARAREAGEPRRLRLWPL